jgi:hypothetical protein
MKFEVEIVFDRVLAFVFEEAGIHGESPEKFISRMISYQSQTHPGRCQTRRKAKTLDAPVRVGASDTA